MGRRVKLPGPEQGHVLVLLAPARFIRPNGLELFQSVTWLNGDCPSAVSRSDRSRCDMMPTASQLLRCPTRQLHLRRHTVWNLNIDLH